MWQTHHFQLIAFTVENSLSCQQNWWQDLCGGDPETTTKKYQKDVKGVWDGVEISLSLDPLRIVWVISPAEEDAQHPPDKPIPTLGPFAGVRDSFLPLMRNWFPHCPPIKRLGFAGRLFRFAQSRELCYDILKSHIKHVSLPDDATDLLYRINRPIAVDSPVKSLIINRLATWSSTKFTSGFQAIDTNTGNVTISVKQPSIHAATLELDINSSAETEIPFSNEALFPLLQQLVDLGAGIVEMGEIL